MSDYEKANGPMCLTKRQVEVLALAAKGLKNYAIAHQLGISQQTVKNHFTGIYRKIFIINPHGTQKRILAVHYALAAGQINWRDI